MSKKNEFKTLLFITALLITFGLALGGNFLHSRYNIENPLLAQIQDLPNVEGSSIEKKDHMYLLRVSLAQVENLQEEFKQLDELAKEKLGEGKYQILIEGRDSRDLDLIYYEIQPVVYQALANNQYVWMKEQINLLAEQDGLEYKMFIDEQRVYLQFSHGDQYQYYIIDRSAPQVDTA